MKTNRLTGIIMTLTERCGRSRATEPKRVVMESAMKKLVCLLLCAAILAGVIPTVHAAEELLEVTVRTHSNLTSSSTFDISGLYADNVFYIDADTVCALTDAQIILQTEESVNFSVHEGGRSIEVRADQTLEEFGYGGFTHQIPVVTHKGQLWISAPDILRYLGAKVSFGEDENAEIHMYVSMPFTVLDLYRKYVDAKGYLFDWSEADGRIFDPDEQLGMSALSTALFEYDAFLLGFADPAYQDQLWQEIYLESILCVMRNDSTELLDPYYKGYQMFGDLSGSMKINTDFIEEIYGSIGDGLCAQYFEESTRLLSKGASGSLTAAGIVVEVSEDYLNAMETAQQFYDMSRSQRVLFNFTLLRSANDPQLYGQNPNFYEAVRTADDMISGAYTAQEYAKKKAAYSLLTQVVTEGITNLNPVIAAADFAVGIVENIAVFDGYLEDDVRIAYAAQCQHVAQLAEYLLSQDFSQNIRTGSPVYRERMYYDMILSLKASITARTLLYNLNYWLKDEARTNMKSKAGKAAELLALAYRAVPNVIGKMDSRNEDLTWIAKLAGCGRVGHVVTVGDKTYYWKYDTASYDSFSGRFHQKASNTLMCMDSKGLRSNYGVYDAYGEFAVTDQWLIVNKTGGGIHLERLDGTQTKAMGHRMQWVSPNGRYMIYTEDNGNLCALSLKTFEKQKLLSSGTFVTAHDGVAYICASGTDSIRLYSWRPGEEDIREVYQSSAKLYDLMYSSLYIAQMRFTEDHIYFSYGASGGSGNYFQGGRIVQVDYDGSNAKVVAGKNALVDWYFTVGADGTVQSQKLQWTVDFSPMEQFVTENGTLYMINSQSGLTFPVLSPSDYAVLGPERLGQVGDSSAILMEFAQVEDQKLYCLLHRCEVDENYGGWRTAYIRQESVMLMRDMATGEVTVLYTIA